MTKRASLNDRKLPQASVPRATDDIVLGMQQARQEIIDLPLRDIMPNRQQPRTQASDSGLQELAESIRQHGVLEPVLVREIPLTLYEGAGRRYELIAGERRWRACAFAARAVIPAIVLTGNTDDRTMLELAIIENLQREDLHPLDEALAFGRMQSELGYSYAQIAERLGKSKGYVQNRMRLLQLDEDLQQLVADRPDTLAHVYELAKIPDAALRAPLVVAVRDDALSRAATRARVQELLAPPAKVDESYFQKYDSAENHNSDDQIQPPAGVEVTESYFQKYDSVKNHNPEQPQPPTSAVHLSAQERSAIAAIASKVTRWLAAPEQFAAADWQALEPLALRLTELLNTMHKRRTMSDEA